MQTSYRFDQVIDSHGVAVRVRCLPRGSVLRDATDKADWLNYFSSVLGELSVLGWLLHRTAFRSKWRVSAESVAPGAVPTIEINGLAKSEAMTTFDSLITWVRDGLPLRDFEAGVRV